MIQFESGYASIFRLSDPKEINLMLRLYNVNETILWKILSMRGYEDMIRCLFFGFTDGEKSCFNDPCCCHELPSWDWQDVPEEDKHFLRKDIK